MNQTIYKTNPNGPYALYSNDNGATWRESASLRNESVERDELAAQLVEVKNNATGKSPCAKFCESVALAKYFQELRDESEKLKVERDALAAYLNTVKSAWISIGNWPDTVDDKKILADAICSTPAQCLAEIKAQAVEDFAKALSNSVQVPNGPITRVDYYKAAIRHTIQFASNYAESIRKGGQ